MWKKEKMSEIKPKGDALVEELFAQADVLVAQSEQFKGCSFYGEWPGSYYLREAALLRQAALRISKVEGWP